MNRKIVLALSGGMDSATLCGYYINKKIDVVPIFFDYGSKHNRYEKEMAKKLADYYGLSIIFVNLDFINALFKSDLLQTGGVIPEGEYQDSNMSQTVVPARNIIFISIMAGYAWSIKVKDIAIGVHTGDHYIYEDCRPEFLLAMSKALIYGTGDKVALQMPFQHLSKIEILKIGSNINVPYEYTRTCYKNQKNSCGKCGSCQERINAFSIIGRKDPIQYD